MRGFSPCLLIRIHNGDKMYSMDKEKRVSIRFPLDVWEMLHTLAQEDGRSVNGQVVWILRDYIKKRKAGNDAQNLQVPNLPK